MAEHDVIRFYAQLNDYEPKIWRRFEINGEKTMAELAYTIMIMFEMQACHLFTLKEFVQENLMNKLQQNFSKEKVQFTINKYRELGIFKDVRYELPIEEMYIGENEKLIEANSIKTGQVIDKEDKGRKFMLEYDFGASWGISICVEYVERREVSLTMLPRVLDGAGYGIIENIGGVRDLKEVANILKSGEGQPYKELTQWLDSTTLDLEKFDQDDINFRLKKLIRMYRNSYENRYPPTENDLKWLLRTYQGKGSQGY